MRWLLALFLWGSGAGTGALLAQASAPTPQTPATEPAIRRWIDVQTVSMMSRFRWVESNTGAVTSSTLQWQPLVRGRVRLDRDGRFAVGVQAQSGSHFVSGWNNTGGGLGEFSGDFSVKQLFFAAEPRPGVELQIGGLPLVRGESSEVMSYDGDAYIVGERLTIRRRSGRLAQVSATVAYIGDYGQPSLFRRLDRLGEWNYGQLLVGLRYGSRAAVSADYTYEDGRHFVRQAVTVRMPPHVPVLVAVKLDGYQRLSGVRAAGVHASGDVRVTRALTFTAGVAHVDRHYLIPGYMSPNADRFERGTRFYSQGSYALTSDLSIGWFHGEAFRTRYPIPNEHRFEVIVTFNPTATLRAKGVL